ncbi:MAG: hypothetical protein LBQ20_07570, partial [Rhodanobacter sp.]|nr:hypothetical protein [Rhodanobacter sp.]
MSRICPFCQHIRKDNEIVPDWQCPACERAYVKGDSTAPFRPGSTRPVLRAAEPSGSGFGK